MKGKILGYDAASGAGAINGESGERFTFVAAQWRSDKAIAAGTQVDFAPVAGVATEIYPVAGTVQAPDLSELAASPAVQKARTLGMTTLAFPLAVLLLIATFLPAMTSPVQSVSLWGLGGIVKMLGANPLFSDDSGDAAEELAKIQQEEAEMHQEMARRGIPIPSAAEIAATKSGTYSMMTGEPTIASKLKEYAEEKESLSQRISDQSWRKNLGTLLALRYLVPIGAVLLIWFAWAGKDTARPSLAVGGVSILTALIVYLYRGALIGHSVKGSIGEAISRQMDAVISVGWGTMLIGACGLGLVLAGLGILRNPLAAKA